MSPDKAERPTPLIPFDAWKARLREDCERNDKLEAYKAFSDFVLKMLWQDGFDPSCAAIAEGPGKPN